MSRVQQKDHCASKRVELIRVRDKSSLGLGDRRGKKLPETDVGENWKSAQT